jgi:hypothetical protein
MTRWPRLSVVASAALIALVTGCGGDDTEQVSAQELIARGDRICEQGSAKFEKVQAVPAPTAATAAEQTGELVDIATEELDELRRIRPPEELSGRYDAYLEARGRALDLLERGHDAAEEKDADAYGAAQSKAAAEAAKRRKLAEAVGFKQCSKPAKP